MCFVLETPRLLLRPPHPRDIPAIVSWAGDWDVAKNLALMPHPYGERDAADFMDAAARNRTLGTGYSFAVTRKRDGVYLGGCGVNLRQGTFELGYWLGKPFWGQGYASEAAADVLHFVFDRLNLDRIVSSWYHDNPASGRVLAKLGFIPQGVDMRDCLARGGQVLCNLVELPRDKFRQKKAA
jgi:RimJ/RimL family protein N-acetyltransferase